MSRLEFIVLGRPQPAGSKRPFAIRKGGVPTGQIVVVEDSKKRVRPWQAEIKAAAVDALGDRDPLTGPLILEVDFYLARPAGHFGSGAKSDRLRASAPPYPAVRPDVTKLLRGLEDALTGLVWRDDAQIVTQIARKRYGSPERAEILVDLAPPGPDELGATRDDGDLEGLFA